MKPAKVMNHLSESELRRRMKNSPNHEHFQCWQSVFLATGGLPVKLIAEYVGSTTGAVHQWVRRYNEYGPDGFDRHPLAAPFSGVAHLP